MSMLRVICGVEIRLFVDQPSALVRRLMKLEISGLIDVWTSDDLERSAWLKVARFEIFDVDDVRRFVDLPNAPSGSQHRAELARPANHAFQGHGGFFKETLGRVKERD